MLTLQYQFPYLQQKPEWFPSRKSQGAVWSAPNNQAAQVCCYYLEVEKSGLYAWTDSTIVLAWLKSTPSRLKVYVEHRVQDVISDLPASRWRHVPTTSNPADYASRGLLPKDFLTKELCWGGPPWLSLPPCHWPTHPHSTAIVLPQLRWVLKSTAVPVMSDLWHRYSHLKKLVRIVVWCLRFIGRCQGSKTEQEPRLTTAEQNAALTKLLRLSQTEVYTREFECLSRSKPVSQSSNLYSLQPMIGSDGLLQVGGKLSEVANHHPIILHRAASLTKLLVQQLHLDSSHAEPSVLLALLAENY